jgi:hypothetical protein
MREINQKIFDASGARDLTNTSPAFFKRIDLSAESVRRDAITTTRLAF